MTTSAISRMGRSPEEGIKAPVKTTALVNVPLFGTGQILNGIVTGTQDRVLVLNQDAPTENGTYNVGPDAWVRTTDMNGADDVQNGQLIVDSNTLIIYNITYPGPGPWSPNNTALAFTQFLAGGFEAVLVNAAPFPVAEAGQAMFFDDDTYGARMAAKLPEGSANASVIIKKLGSTGNVTISSDFGELVEGLLEYDLIAKGASITLIFNGANWSIV